MSEVAERYATIANGFTRRVGGVPKERWASPSPCSEWAARDVMAHVVNTHYRVLATLDGAEAPVVEADDDAASRWPDVRDAILDALNDEARASQVVSGIFSDQPFSSLVGRLLCSDTLIHTWDLARATGQDDRLDPIAAARALEFLTTIDEAIRRPGGFAAKIEPAPGADEQTKLLNFAGRAVDD